MAHEEVGLVRALATAALNYTRSSDMLDAAHNGIPRRFSNDESGALVQQRDAARSEFLEAFYAAATASED